MNLGKYQRESFLEKNLKSNNAKQKEEHFIKIILNAYNAEKIDNQILHGIKNNRYVYIGITFMFLTSCRNCSGRTFEKQDNKVDTVFDHEQGLFPNIMNEAAEKGVDISCKIIPPDVLTKELLLKIR